MKCSVRMAAVTATLLGMSGPFHDVLAQTPDSGVVVLDVFVVDVVTASKLSESLSEAPAVVSTVTADEIAAFGATNLAEVLDRMPAFMALGSFLFPQGVVAVRGDMPNHVNPHVLFLLDGRPMREAVLGGFNAATLTGFPLEAIERLEVIRGPGSVLYGSGAYAGVVNIITKKAQGNHASASSGFGGFGARLGRAAAEFEHGGLEVTGRFQLHHDDGWAYQGNLSPAAQTVGLMREKVMSSTVSARYGPLSLSTFLGTNDQGNFNTDPVRTPGISSNRRVFADMGFEQELVEWWTASANITYNRVRDSWPSSGGTVRGSADDFVFEATNYLRPGGGVNVLVGATVDRQEGRWFLVDNPVVTPVPDFTQHWWSVYGQVDYRPVRRLKLIAGGQLNKPTGIAADFVPRFGAVVNATDGLGVKLLYGQAFRAAQPGETAINIPGTLVGNPTLTPEKITTLDGQVFYHARRTQLAATVFKSHQRNLISRRLATEDPNYRLAFANRGELNSWGIELESKVSPVSNLFFLGSFSYQQSETDLGVQDPASIPNTMVKFGASYSHPRGLSVGAYDSYFSEPNAVVNVNPNTQVLNPDARAFHYVSANVSLYVPALVYVPGMPDITLSLYGVNLLGEEVSYPETVFRAVNTQPGRGGRALYASLQVGF